MTFTSLLFAPFLSVVFLLHAVAPQRLRWIVLLAASYGFYAFFHSVWLLASLAGTTAIAYAVGLWMTNPGRGGRGIGLSAGILGCLAILFVTKYLPHFPSVKHTRFAEAVLSIGVSYYAFQAISYLIDVYMEVQEPERHLGYFALYLAFFPKLLQGPLERAHHLLPQLKEHYRLDAENIRSAMLLFGWGLFIKVVIAERVGRYANAVYDNLHSHTGPTLILATYCYAVQIYCDFAGYTNMARATARLFNIDLVENFNHPYAASSVADFWRRWHMSFSRWILDYIFKPLQLGWRDWGKTGTALALLCTFIASGLWHGASWGFVVWGLLHGIYLAASVFYQPYRKRLHRAMGVGNQPWYRALQVFATFNLVAFAWIFFRANSLQDAFYVVRHLANLSLWTPGAILLGDGVRNAVPLALMAAVLLGGYWGGALGDYFAGLQRRPAAVRWPAYLMLTFLTVLFGVWGADARFVYFAF